MPSKPQSGNLKPLLLILAAVAVVFIIILFIYDDSIKSAVTRNKAAVVGDPQVQMLNNQSKSDDVGSIEKDLNNTNLDNIDQGTTQINQGLTTLPN